MRSYVMFMIYAISICYIFFLPLSEQKILTLSSLVLLHFFIRITNFPLSLNILDFSYCEPKITFGLSEVLKV